MYNDTTNCLQLIICEDILIKCDFINVGDIFHQIYSPWKPIAIQFESFGTICMPQGYATGTWSMIRLSRNNEICKRYHDMQISWSYLNLSPSAQISVWFVFVRYQTCALWDFILTYSPCNTPLWTKTAARWRLHLCCVGLQHQPRPHRPWEWSLSILPWFPSAFSTSGTTQTTFTDMD